MKYLILGAGPAGLAFGCQLLKNGEEDFLILEQEQEAGGLCRSVEVDGSPFDIGGGHFLDVRRPKVNEFLFSYMPEEEWNSFSRDSRIEIGDYQIHHPFEANIWELPIEAQAEYLESIAQAGCNSGTPMPERFVDWIKWKLGEKISADYMLPYNRKMFADELNELGTYWLEKLPDVSFKETLLSCLTRQAFGKQPGHAQFYYPKNYGYGEVWLRMADSIKDHIIYGTKVVSLDFTKREVGAQDGMHYSADQIVTTIPWGCFEEIIGAPEEIVLSIKRLKSSSVETRYCSDNLDTKAHWIYYPDDELPYHRILVRHNFCEGSRGYWMETRGERVRLFKQYGMETGKGEEFTYVNQYAYPLNTLDKPELMKVLLAYAEDKGVIGLGRWGEHCHFNSDVTVERAMNLANVCTGRCMNYGV